MRDMSTYVNSMQTKAIAVIYYIYFICIYAISATDSTLERLGSLVPACERQICLSHAGTRESNLSHHCTSGEALA